MNVKDPIPRSTMTADQQRRIGALQAAKSLVVPNAYHPVGPQDAEAVLGMAVYIEKGVQS